MFWLIAVICIFLCLLWADVKKPHGYPPGPTWLPVVGNYLWFQQQKKKLGYHHLVWDSLYAKYGPVVGVRLGRTRVIVMSGYDAARDVLLRDEFEGRPDGFFFRLRTFGKQLGNAEQWLELLYCTKSQKPTSKKYFDKKVHLNYKEDNVQFHV